MRIFTLNISAICLIIAVSGCTIAKPIMTPSGQQGFTINCSGAGDIGSCYEKASELCGASGYEIFDQKNQSAGFFTHSDRTMIIRCKSPTEQFNKSKG